LRQKRTCFSGFLKICFIESIFWSCLVGSGILDYTINVK
jgi:hypothetical protein